MKKTLLIISLLLSLFITGCGCEKKETQEVRKKETIVVTEENVIKNQNVDGIEFTNTELTVTNGVSKIKVSVTNNSTENYNLNEYSIIFKDENDNVIAKMPGYVGETINAGETKHINASIDIDVSKAKKVEYDVKK